MTETVTVKRPTGTFAQSPSGDPVADYEELGTTTMYLEPRFVREMGTEAMEGGYTPIGDWLGVGRWDFDFGSHDVIVWGTRVFDILSPPRVMPNPRLGTLSHTELDLQLVGDMDDEGAPDLGEFSDAFSLAFSGGVATHEGGTAMPGAVGGVGG